ncbi:transcriptional regulator [Streptomyces sp. XM83C]|uniref:transcriptional regulator n=1 Tax=unclassified Streptomyces TaxID=2593676 RepID=UPI001FF9914E|nr:transcriptional regulator [Streptomyces sp. XM83C]MCK1819123.1 transcriptional regulator [Streptomyces sp. XM83C]
MTVTQAPPPLPMRDKARDRTAEAAAREGVGGLSPMLTRLAAERATGVLVREGGALYLAGGLVLHAESPYAPGIGTLLTAGGVLPAEEWWRAAGIAGDLPGTARLLLAGGRLTPAALEICHLHALYDAAYFALAPSSSPGRFHYGPAPDADGPLPAVPVAAVEREVLRRRALLHRLWPDALLDGVPLLRSTPVAAPGVTTRQAAVLSLADGVRTAPDIALAQGRRVFPTLVEVRRLAAAGLLGTPPPPGAASPPSELPDVDPHIALLKRVRDALEAL